MRKTWVQDAKETKVPGLIEKMTARNIGRHPQGSKYVVGEPKSGRTDEKGIYFEDPTGRASDSPVRPKS